MHLQENYAPEWPNSIPARRIARYLTYKQVCTSKYVSTLSKLFFSAGSLSFFQSKSSLRRPSEPAIDEESDEEDESDNENNTSQAPPQFQVGGTV